MNGYHEAQMSENALSASRTIGTAIKRKKMADIYLKKFNGMLAPADENAVELIAKMKHGQAIKVKYSFPRNYENHKRFFAFIQVTFDIQDHFDNIKHYRKWIIMKSGHYKIITAPNGYQIFDADSMAFDKMDEPTFQSMFSDCIDVFLSVWGDRISRDELLRVVDFS